MLDLAAPAQIFGHLGGGRYTLDLAGLEVGQVPTSTGIPVTADHDLRALRHADTIVVPGFADWPTATFPAASAALAEAHGNGARIMSICTGAFVLAEAGLLDGRRATTHWSAADDLAKWFPDVVVDPGVLYIDEGSVLTSAGVAAGLDLCLHVVRRDYGAAVATEFARFTVFAPHREGGQAQFIPTVAPAGCTEFSPGTTERTRAWSLGHLDQPLSVGQLADHAGMTRRTFTRRFLQETGTTPAQWLLEQRLRAAQTLLETTAQPIERIASRTGFGSPGAMRAHFQRRLRTTPTAYRRSFASCN